MPMEALRARLLDRRGRDWHGGQVRNTLSEINSTPSNAVHAARPAPRGAGRGSPRSAPVSAE